MAMALAPSDSAGASGMPFAQLGPGDGAADMPVLVIDLDGTLVRCDLLHESLLKLIVVKPSALWSLPAWLLQGKARFKREVANRVDIDATLLPYDPSLVDWIIAQRATGRRVVLCTASDQKLALAVADHLPIFDAVMASDGQINLSSGHKAQALVERFGAKGFDYAGNSLADVPVWAAARRAIVVAAPRGVQAAARRVSEVERTFGQAAGGVRRWLKAMRMHQWVKNLLVFLPLLGAHQMLQLPLLLQALWAFIAFSLCASSVYLLNDMMDLDSDRRHPRKRERPFASGRLPVSQGLVASALLVAGAFTIAIVKLPLGFTAWLAAYLGLTLCYTFWLKRKILVDSLVLAALYTMRVLAGSAAVGIAPGFWLLAFSLFLFLSLALVKRYSELAALMSAGQRIAAGRDYLVDDRHLVQTLGIASGFSSVMVLALYMNGDSVSRLYPHQELIWFTVPLLLYWISRLWLKAHRDQLDDDPVIFAMTDNVSRATIALFFATLLLASAH